MIKLIDIYNEVRINKPIANNLKKLEQLKAQIKASKSDEEKASLAIQCAELVLPIYEREYPNDNRVRKSLEAAKRGEYDDSAYDACIDAPAGSAAESAADAASSAVIAASVAYAASSAANHAIRATKIFFKLDEVKINNPNSKEYLGSEKYYNKLKDKLILFIKDEYISRINKDLIKQIIEENISIFHKFIKLDMINTNYELNNDIITNKTKISKDQIINYVFNNKNYKNTIYKILVEYYIENISFDEIYKNALEYFRKGWKIYYEESINMDEKTINAIIKYSIIDAIDNSEIDIYPESILTGNDFNEYLNNKLLRYNNGK